MTDIALISGITGQDGSYLAELLLSKGYEVHGIMRRASSFNTQRIDHIYKDPHDPEARLFLHYGDIGDSGSLTSLINQIEPNEIYNLGAQSHVRVSFEIPEYTGLVSGLGVTCMLEAIRKSSIETKFYQASSSEMFGSAPPPQNEKSPFYPRSPYATAKVYAYWMTVNYREGYGLFAANGILFNHESPRRGRIFVTRKITAGLANILAKKQPKIFLGNLEARRDWGFAPEYVEIMWRMLQQSSPEDYVIGTGENHSVKDFLDCAFGYVGLDWEKYVEIDSRYYRPTEVESLKADPRKAREQLNWQPQVSFKELVELMVDADMNGRGIEAPGNGLSVVRQKGFNWADISSVTD
ncbi:MAG: GDP-mannose 4,6-dehydratase [Candidatus Heimdallarchaeota archaeon]